MTLSFSLSHARTHARTHTHTHTHTRSPAALLLSLSLISSPRAYPSVSFVDFFSLSYIFSVLYHTDQPTENCCVFLSVESISISNVTLQSVQYSEYTQKYRRQWATIHVHTACIVTCKADFYAKLSDVKKHMATQKHIQKAKPYNSATQSTLPVITVKVDEAKKAEATIALAID